MEVSPAVSPQSEPLPVGSKVGRFVIDGLVGQGGMGVVYSALDPKLSRRVALKAVRAASAGDDDGDSSATRARFVREAQAMARLSHPNVLPVFDILDEGDVIYVAMELLRGATLTEWLRGGERSLRDILAVFIAAGRGLGAAHAAGIVHRDFKPDNVIVAGDRVCVLDFGLARGLGEPGEGHAGAAHLGEEITHTGALLGTPAFMAPELFFGATATVATDQYSFAVALYAALFGKFPPSPTPRAAPRAVPPRLVRVPARLRRVLDRALAIEAGARYPSMAALLDDLGRDPYRKPLLALAGAAGAAVLAVGAVALLRSPVAAPRPSCDVVDSGWDASAAPAVRASFVATGLPYAATAADRAVAALDRRAADHQETARSLCRAKFERGELSDVVYDRALGCLATARKETATLVGLFTAADARTVEHAGEASAALGPVADCADKDAMTRLAPPPASAVVWALVGETQAQLGAVRAFAKAFRFKAALDVSLPILATARALGYKPLLAAALQAVGASLTGQSRFEPALGFFREAEMAAEAGGDDPDKVAAQVAVIGSLTALDRFDEAGEWARRAAASLERIGNDPQLRASYLAHLGIVSWKTGQFVDGLAQVNEAIALLAPRVPPADRHLQDARTERASILQELGRFDEAGPELERFVAAQIQAYGPDHPFLINGYAHLADNERQRHQLATAEMYARRAVDLAMKVAPGTEHESSARDSLSDLLGETNRFDESRKELERSIEIRTKTRGPNSINVATTWGNYGAEAFLAHDFPAARKAQETELAILEKYHPEATGIGYAHFNLGEVIRMGGQPREALPHFRRAFDVFTKMQGGKDVLMASASGMGAAYADLGDDTQALVWLQQALGYATDLDSPELADAYWALAKVWAKKDRSRASGYLEKARVGMRHKQPTVAWQVEDLESWAKANGF